MVDKMVEPPKGMNFNLEFQNETWTYFAVSYGDSPLRGFRIRYPSGWVYSMKFGHKIADNLLDLIKKLEKTPNMVF